MQNAWGLALWAFTEQEKHNLSDDKLIEKAYSQVFATEAGRIILAHLMVSEAVMQPSFNINSKTEEAIYRDGRKAIVSDIITRILNTDIKFIYDFNAEDEENDRFAAAEY